MTIRTLTVRGSATVSAVPDWVVITFEVTSRDYEYTRAVEGLSVQTECLRQSLTEAGLSRESLKTADFRVEANHERRQERRLFTGYTATHRLRVEFALDRKLLNGVLARLGDSAGEAAFRVMFSLKDSEPQRRQAMAAALRDAREKAVVLAEAAGLRLEEILTVDYSWSEVRFNYSMELPASHMLAAASHDVQPDDVDVQDHVTVVWRISSEVSV